jgi:Na+/H+-dicarboxylate symporter
MKLSSKIILGMVLGVVVGLILNGINAGSDSGPLTAWLVEYIFDVVGRIFIASLKLLVVPLVFVSLVCGSAAMGENIKMGRIAFKTLALYLLTTAVAITLALSFANIINPGVGIDTAAVASFSAPIPPSFKDVLIGIFPTNPIKAMSDGNMLQIIVFSILVGVAITQAGKAGKGILSVFQDFNDVIMRLAPFGVFCLLAKLFTEEGFAAIYNLALYFMTVTLVLLVHAGVVYTSIFSLFTRLNPLTLLKNIRPAMLFAFSTSSSNATMPVTMNVMEKRVGVDNSVASFTVPLGATINMDGTAIMQGVATVFIAQAYGLDLGLTEYLAVIATATLASIGTAGVPGVGLIMLSMVLQQVGLPVEGIGLIIGVDRLLDMMRTVVNITGDSTVTSVVAKSEGMLDEKVFNEVSDRDEYSR